MGKTKRKLLVSVLVAAMVMPMAVSAAEVSADTGTDNGMGSLESVDIDFSGEEIEDADDGTGDGDGTVDESNETGKYETGIDEIEIKEADETDLDLEELL